MMLFSKATIPMPKRLEEVAAATILLLYWSTRATAAPKVEGRTKLLRAPDNSPVAFFNSPRPFFSAACQIFDAVEVFPYSLAKALTALDAEP